MCIVRKPGPAGIIAFLGIFGALICRGAWGQGADEKEWTESLLKTRQAKDAVFRDPWLSPLSQILRSSVEPGDEAYLTVAEGSAAIGPRRESGSILAVSYKGPGRWTPLVSGIVGPDGAIPGPDNEIGDDVRIRFGDMYIRLAGTGKGIAVDVHDASRKDFVGFRELPYFPSDVSFRVSAKYLREVTGRSMELSTSGLKPRPYLCSGTVEFDLFGEPRRLLVFRIPDPEAGGAILFIPFRDMTSGEETYGAGRYLEVPEPQGDDLTLDFNLAHNPLCAYMESGTCPLPPMENTLNAAVKAGEKAFHAPADPSF